MGQIERKVVRAALIWPLLGVLVSLTFAVVLATRVFGNLLPSRQSVTLEMSWHRGDPHYGPNFVYLDSPCLSNSEQGCFCSQEFKATASKEFADYIEGFGANKVPVKYEVVYADPKVIGAILLGVGDWPSTRFQETERFIVTDSRMVANRSKSAAHINSPGDCFPPPNQ